nr:phospholipase-like protein [Tanacetum cinerariifolium]
MWYVPRSPLVSIGGMYREYLNKRSAARAAKKKYSKDFHPSECVREASLIDRVRDLEGICDTLLRLPKEVKSLRGRIHKLKSIIQSTFYPSRVVEKQETLKKVIPQIEDYLQSTSEDKPDIKDHTSPKKDDGNVYCYDDNGDFSLFFMPAKPVVVDRCKFPWCNDITVDRSFWNGLCALDDNRKGWLLNEVTYLWLTRHTNMDWAMVSSYLLPLLLQGSMPLFYANNDIYPIPWSDVERIGKPSFLLLPSSYTAIVPPFRDATLIIFLSH